MAGKEKSRKKEQGHEQKTVARTANVSLIVNDHSEC